MPQKSKGGRKKRRGKKPQLNNNTGKKKTNLADLTAGELYAKVLKREGGAKGSAMVVVECSDSKERKARIPGSWHRRVWINAGDFLRVNIPEELTVDNKVQIIELYDDSDIVRLRNKCTVFSKFESGIKESDEKNNETVDNVFEFDDI
jgi:initiation factor 1A